MKYKDLERDPLIIEWLNDINASKKTKFIYLNSLQNFTEFVNKTPEELLEEAEEEIKKGVLPRKRKIKLYLINFRKQQKDLGLSDLTVKTRMTGVRSFYRSFDIEIPRIHGDQKPRTLKENNTIPTKEDLQEVLKVCNPLEKAILLTGVSSGLSANEIRNLKILDFKRGYDPETEITTLSLRREKVGFDFVTFLSPEASKAVNDYLEFREREPKIETVIRSKQLEKQKTHSDEGYLFILQSVSDKYLESCDEELRHLNERAFFTLYRSISEKAKKNTKSNTWNLIRSHNMRKYFNSVLLNNGADSFFVEFVMGHTLDDTRAAYFRASPEKLKEIYKKYLPFLTIEKGLDITDSPDFKRVIEENEVLRAERQELNEIKKEIDRIKRWNEEKAAIEEATKFDIKTLEEIQRNRK